MICILCEGSSFDVVASKVRFDVPRKVVRCQGCGLVSLSDPGLGTMDYSESDYRRLHGPVLGRSSSAKEIFDIYFPFQRQRVDRTSHLIHSETRLLEIGCSTGHFLHEVRNRVREAVGVELNPEHAAYGRELGLRIVDEPIEVADIPQEYFDVIFMFQVFEHIEEPLAFLDHCRSLLKPNGTLYMEVPNLDDALLTIYSVPDFRDFYFRIPHIYYYTAGTLPKMLSKAGFTGSTSYAQEYTLFNHLHWLLTGKPQPDHTSASTLPTWLPESDKQEISDEIRRWLSKTDMAYRLLLEELGVSEHLCYEGTRM